MSDVLLGFTVGVFTAYVTVGMAVGWAWRNKERIGAWIMQRQMNKTLGAVMDDGEK